MDNISEPVIDEPGNIKLLINTFLDMRNVNNIPTQSINPQNLGGQNH